MSTIIEKLIRMKALSAYILVMSLAVALYAQSARFQFTLDDPLVTTLNAQVRDFKPGDLAAVFSSHFYSGASNVGSNNSNLYRPVAKLTFVMDYLLAGRKFAPESFHLTNIILYALLCAVVLRFLRRLMPDSPLETFCMAIIFTALPSHTEVVANVKHREEILSLLFALSAWLAVTSGSGKKRAGLFLGPILFLLALLSKESALLLLPMFFLGEYVFRGIRPRPCGLVLAAAPVVVYFLLRFQALGTLFSPKGTMTFFLPDEGLLVRLLTSSYIFAKYYLWGQLVFQQLNPFFSHRFVLQPGNALSVPYLASLALCLVLALSGLTACLRRKSIAGYWLLFFFFTAGLAMNIIPIGTAGAYRLIFTPSLGLCAFVVSVVGVTIRLAAGKDDRSKWWLVLICLPLTAFYSYKTYTITRRWQNSYTLFAAAARIDPRNPLSSYWAGSFSGEGITPVKIGHYRTALIQYAANSDQMIEFSERDLEAYAIMATETAYSHLENDPMAAIRLAETAISVFKRLAVVRNNQQDENAPGAYYVKAMAEYSLGRRGESLKSCMEGLMIHPHEGLRQLQEKIMGKRAE